MEMQLAPAAAPALNVVFEVAVKPAMVIWLKNEVQKKLLQQLLIQSTQVLNACIPVIGWVVAGVSVAATIFSIVQAIRLLSSLIDAIQGGGPIDHLVAQLSEAERIEMQRVQEKAIKEAEPGQINSNIKPTATLINYSHGSNCLNPFFLGNLKLPESSRKELVDLCGDSVSAALQFRAPGSTLIEFRSRVRLVMHDVIQEVVDHVYCGLATPVTFDTPVQINVARIISKYFALDLKLDTLLKNILRYDGPKKPPKTKLKVKVRFCVARTHLKDSIKASLGTNGFTADCNYPCVKQVGFINQEAEVTTVEDVLKTIKIDPEKFKDGAEAQIDKYLKPKNAERVKALLSVGLSAYSGDYATEGRCSHGCKVSSAGRLLGVIAGFTPGNTPKPQNNNGATIAQEPEERLPSGWEDLQNRIGTVTTNFWKQTLSLEVEFQTYVIKEGKHIECGTRSHNNPSFEAARLWAIPPRPIEVKFSVENWGFD